MISTLNYDILDTFAQIIESHPLSCLCSQADRLLIQSFFFEGETLTLSIIGVNQQIIGSPHGDRCSMGSFESPKNPSRLDRKTGE
jgi:hypothetical protein